MFRGLRSTRGFSLAEVLIVIALLGILASVVLLNMSGSDVKAKESNLQSNLEVMRSAVNMYKYDHGFYPGSKDDQGYPLNEQAFKNKLLLFTDDTGRASKTKTTRYRYGPYLKKFPVEPFGNTDAIEFSLNNENAFSELAKTVQKSAATGGWFYEVESGNVLANLGTDFPKEYAGF